MICNVANSRAPVMAVTPRALNRSVVAARLSSVLATRQAVSQLRKSGVRMVSAKALKQASFEPVDLPS